MADFLDEKDFEKLATQMKVKMVRGNVAPRYDRTTKQAGIEKVIITEQGVQSGLPLVDLQLIDRNGDKLFVAVSGRLMQSIASVINGTNERIHGVPNP